VNAQPPAADPGARGPQPPPTQRDTAGRARAAADDATDNTARAGADGPGDAIEDEPLLYTVEEAAALLQVRSSWLRRKAATRAVPCTFLGKHLRFSRTDLDTIIDGGAQPIAPARQRPPTVPAGRRPARRPG
jgi:excisionase family DNA binding protein